MVAAFGAAVAAAAAVRAAAGFAAGFERARGEWIGAIALSEPDAGSDLAGVSTRAVLEGDEWVVTGHKRWCGNAKAADFIQVLVRERDPEEVAAERTAELEQRLQGFLDAVLR